MYPQDVLIMLGKYLDWVASDYGIEHYIYHVLTVLGIAIHVHLG